MKHKMYYIFSIILSFIVLLLNCAQPGTGLFDFFDTTPVEIEDYRPNSESITDENINIYIKFSKEMNVDSVENAFTFEEFGGDVTYLPGNFSWSGADKELNFTLKDRKKKYEYGKQYRITIKTSAEDVNGNDLKKEFVHTYMLGSDKDAPYVVLEECAPVPNAKLDDSHLKDPVIIVFSEPMNKESATKYLKVKDETGQNISGTWQWLDENGRVVEEFSNTTSRKIRFVEHPDFEMKKGYEVEISDEITDIYNNRLRKEESYTFDFYGNYEKPVIKSFVAHLNLVNGEDDPHTHNLEEGIIKQGITRNVSFSIYFSHRMKREETANAIKLNSSIITVNYTWRTDLITDDRLDIDLDVDNYFEYNRTYTFVISKDAQDIYNNTIELKSQKDLEEDYYKFKVNHASAVTPSLQRIVVTKVQKYNEERALVDDDKFKIDGEVVNKKQPDEKKIDLLSRPAVLNDKKVIFSYGDASMHDDVDANTKRVFYFDLYFYATTEMFQNSFYPIEGKNNPNFDIKNTNSGSSGKLNMKLIAYNPNISQPYSENSDYYTGEPGQYVYTAKIELERIDDKTEMNFIMKGGNEGVHDCNGEEEKWTNYLEKTISFYITFLFDKIK